MRDEHGIQLALEHGANPNYNSHWKNTPFQHVVLRDSSLEIIRLLLDHGADPTLETREGRTAYSRAAQRGRGDILTLFARGIRKNHISQFIGKY